MPLSPTAPQTSTQTGRSSELGQPAIGVAGSQDETTGELAVSRNAFDGRSRSCGPVRRGRRHRPGGAGDGGTT